mmetsp:Transcript_4190/g.7670  ORF Transcript_4190/g.7670 Transcript_4190/m.7670 type:complete len:124 (+) Transcript_4190:128-499(+)
MLGMMKVQCGVRGWIGYQTRVKSDLSTNSYVLVVGYTINTNRYFVELYSNMVSLYIFMTYMSCIATAILKRNLAGPWISRHSDCEHRIIHTPEMQGVPSLYSSYSTALANVMRTPASSTTNII